jgi:hypothetical protein
MRNSKAVSFGSLVLFLSFSISACSTPELLNDISEPEYSVYPNRPTPDHSGMWLLPQVKDDIQSSMNRLGLNLTQDEVYSTVSPSLNQGVVRINIGDSGGGTGSFISGEGLILTNHHVAYDGIVSVSSTDQNLLQSGYYAEDINLELSIPGYSLYIPIEQTEVTELIRMKIPDGLSGRELSVVESEVRKELVEVRQGGNNDLVVEINDYWSGNRQFMSVYQVIRDVRLVYAPEEEIGKFGGDTDNWMWPRHTGDFALLRAYVSPDGRAEHYQPSNVPFTPEKSFPLRAGQLQPGNFTLTLGFPGTTYRLESSYAFRFYEEQQFPSLKNAFSAYLKGLQLEAEQSEEYAVINAGERASIANALKYYEGVQSGFEKYKISEKKSEADRQFQQWVQADSLREITYGRVLQQLKQSYHIAGQTGDILFLSFYSIQFSKILQMGALFNDFYEYSVAPDSLFFSSDDRQQLYDQVRLWDSTMNRESELLILSGLLEAMVMLPEERRPLIFWQFFESGEPENLINEIRNFITRQSNTSVLTDTSIAAEWIYTEMAFSEEAFNDSLYLLSRDLHQMFEQSRDNYFQHFNYLEPAQKRYTQGMLEMQQDTNSYPDANFTLRLSAGQVMGYRPADGIYYTPFTTFSGMLEKHTGREPFNVPSRLRNYREDLPSSDRPFGKYSGATGDLVLNFLSTNDITGGNSGSPVLNGNGELIGLAFDGNIEGIVSDYYVVPDVTRTISVDARYILFILDEIDKTERLLEEIEVRLD